LLVCIITIQFSGACWTGWNTANDKIDGLEKCVVYSIECLSSCFVLASAIVAEKKEGEEVNLEKLALSLQLTSYSGQMLMVGIFFPMSITVYNSFVVPLFQIAWGSDGSKAEIACQMFMTLILTPYEILTTFFGLKGGGILMAIAGEFEGSLVEMGASAAGLGGSEDDEGEDKGEGEEGKEDGDGGEKDAYAAPNKEAGGVSTVDGVGVGVAIGIGAAGMTSAASLSSKQVKFSPDTSKPSVKDDEDHEEDEDVEEVLKGPVSAGAKKRMKRAVFLTRVRSRKAAREGKNVEEDAYYRATP